MFVCVQQLENGLGITIPEDILQHLHIKNGTTVELTLQGNHLSVTPQKDHIPYSIDILRKNYKKQILDIASANKAKNIRVFGSVARGEARIDSDIDFLVTMDPGSGLEICSLQCALEDLLDCKVDIVEDISLHSRIKDKIIEEAVPL